MEMANTTGSKRTYERPTVSRVVIDLLQEMLASCSQAQGGKTTFPSPECPSGPGS